MILNPIDTALNILEKVYGEADIVAHAREQLRRLREAAQQSEQRTATPEPVCWCGSLYGVHEEFCPKFKSAGR